MGNVIGESDGESVGLAVEVAGIDGKSRIDGFMVGCGVGLLLGLLVLILVGR